MSRAGVAGFPTSQAALYLARSLDESRPATTASRGLERRRWHVWGFLIPALGLTQDRPPHPAAVTWGKRPAAPADLPDGFGRGHVPPSLAVVAPPPLVVGVVAAVHPGPALGVLGSLLGMLAVLVGLTTIGGRLLGVRLSWWRALIAAGPGFVAGL